MVIVPPGSGAELRRMAIGAGGVGHGSTPTSRETCARNTSNTSDMAGLSLRSRENIRSTMVATSTGTVGAALDSGRSDPVVISFMT